MSHVFFEAPPLTQNPLANTQLENGDFIDLPELLPMRIKKSGNVFELFFEQDKIGDVLFRYVGDRKTTGVQFSLDLRPSIPERIAPAICNALRPFVFLVMQKEEEKKALVNAVKTEAVEWAGTPDHDKVNAVYEGPYENLRSLSVPEIFAKVAPLGFFVEYDHYGSNNAYVHTITYKRDGIKVPLAKIRCNGRGLEIMGTGNREKARLGFVSDLLERASEVARGLTNDFMREMPLINHKIERRPRTHERQYHVNYFFGFDARNAVGRCNYQSLNIHSPNKPILLKREALAEEGAVEIILTDNLTAVCAPAKLSEIKVRVFLGDDLIISNFGDTLPQIDSDSLNAVAHAALIGMLEAGFPVPAQISELLVPASDEQSRLAKAAEEEEQRKREAHTNERLMDYYGG